MVLTVENAITDRRHDVADRIAQQTLARRGVDYATEVRRLLDAALEVIRKCGTTSRPRVADIVATAGVSNDAFYRHFASKDALIAAILEDGTERLVSYLSYQIAKETEPEAKVRAWVEGVLSQATDDDVASTTLAVLWNAGSVDIGPGSGPPSPSTPLATLLREPFAQLGSSDPDLDAALAADATIGRLSEHLWQRTPPTSEEIAHIVGFWIRAVTPRITNRPTTTRH